MNTVVFDRLGSVASATCALHCLTMALAPALVTLLGVEFLAGEAVEWSLYGFAVVFALVAGALGYRTHRSLPVLGGFCLGLMVLSAARLGEAFHLFGGTLVLAVLGGGILVATHVLSARRVRSCCASGAGPR
jgi:hypothetical protein